MAWTDQCKGKPNKIPDTIYFVKSDNGLLKIGIAYDVAFRFKELCKQSPVALKLLGTIIGKRAEERKIHKKFEHLQSHGEWFKYTPELRDFVNSHVEED